jgi:hypothetical protein
VRQDSLPFRRVRVEVLRVKECSSAFLRYFWHCISRSFFDLQFGVLPGHAGLLPSMRTQRPAVRQRDRQLRCGLHGLRFRLGHIRPIVLFPGEGEHYRTDYSVEKSHFSRDAARLGGKFTRSGEAGYGNSVGYAAGRLFTMKKRGTPSLVVSICKFVCGIA